MTGNVCGAFSVCRNYCYPSSRFTSCFGLNVLTSIEHVLGTKGLIIHVLLLSILWHLTRLFVVVWYMSFLCTVFTGAYKRIISISVGWSHDQIDLTRHFTNIQFFNLFRILGSGVSQECRWTSTEQRVSLFLLGFSRRRVTFLTSCFPLAKRDAFTETRFKLVHFDTFCCFVGQRQKV